MISIFLAMSAIVPVDDHDVPMAIFTVSAAEEGVLLSVEFDQEDYTSANDVELMAPDQCTVEDYLNQTTSWTIDGVKQSLQIQDLKLKGGHIKARFSFSSARGQIKELEIENRFLLTIPNQTNVIMLKLYDRSRGFRMHEGRQEIVVNY
ncbi:MAG: DUF6702 family protein [Bacteroidota bacterium]